MDYETKPISRKDIRILASLFRVVFNLPSEGRVNPVELLDQIKNRDEYKNVEYEIVLNEELPTYVPSQCTHTRDGYLIQIKEKTYIKAYRYNSGANRMHIMHEIVHVFLDKQGYKPIINKQVTADIPVYKRIEWITKALTGEIMMPYEETKNLNRKEIMEKYGVSKLAAQTRLKY